MNARRGIARRQKRINDAVQLQLLGI